MSSYSAAQVISPAIQRTRWFLFQPFRLGRFLKLALVAVLTEGGMSSCNFNSSFPSSHPGSGGSGVPFHWPAIHWPALPIIVGVVALVCAIVIPLFVLISYLVIRLRFAYFDCVLRGQDRIGPAWSRYHRQALRYLGLSLCLGLALWAVLIPVGFGLYLHFRPLLDTLRSGGKVDFTAFLPLIGVAVLLAFCLGLAAYCLEATLSSFVLPRMALQDASIREALEDVWIDLRAETGQFLLFYLLRALLTIAASIVAVILLLVPFAIVGVLGAIVVIAIKMASTEAAFLFGVPLGILFVGVWILASISVGGVIGTFRRNYALFFYAGRFPEMAAILWPPQPPPPPPYWGQPAPPAIE